MLSGWDVRTSMDMVCSEMSLSNDNNIASASDAMSFVLFRAKKSYFGRWLEDYVSYASRSQSTCSLSFIHGSRGSDSEVLNQKSV